MPPRTPLVLIQLQRRRLTEQPMLKRRHSSVILTSLIHILPRHAGNIFDPQQVAQRLNSHQKLCFSDIESIIYFLLSFFHFPLGIITITTLFLKSFYYFVVCDLMDKSLLTVSCVLSFLFSRLHSYCSSDYKSVPRFKLELFMDCARFSSHSHLRCPASFFSQLFSHFSARCKKQIWQQSYIRVNYQFLLRMQTTNTQFPFSHTNSSISQPTKRIIIDERFLLRRLLCKQTHFNIYEGVDLEAFKFVTIYIKPPNVDFNFSKRIKEDLRNKISPRVIWTGPFKIQKTVYKIQIHEKSGPSLKAMFNYIKNPISQKDFLLLMYQLIKLVERYGSVGYAYRQLDMERIVFDSSPQKNELYLLNVFPLRKRGDELPVVNTRFCSKGAHLGLKSSTKDDLESVCYILMHIYTQGAFLRNVSVEDYQDRKANINFSRFERPMPPLFIDFYSYVMGLNHSDEVSYFKWRTMIYKIIGRETLMKPYEWMLAKGSDEIIEEEFSEKRVEQEFDVLEIEDQLTAEDQMLIGKLKREMIKNNQKR